MVVDVECVVSCGLSSGFGRAWLPMLPPQRLLDFHIHFTQDNSWRSKTVIATAAIRLNGLVAELFSSPYLARKSSSVAETKARYFFASRGPVRVIERSDK